MKTQNLSGDQVWLRLEGCHVVTLKPEFDDDAIQLERELGEGIPAHPDPVRANFYDVLLDGRWMYIHVQPDRQLVYVVALFSPTINSLVGDTSWRRDWEFKAANYC